MPQFTGSDFAMSGKNEGADNRNHDITVLIVLSLLTDGKRPETGKTPEYVIALWKWLREDSGKSQINNIVRRICDEYPYQLLEMPVERDQEEAQIEGIRALIAYKVDLIVLAPVVGREWETVLRESDAAGIPILTIDQGIAETIKGIDVSYIGFDYYDAAVKLAKCYLERADEESTTLELYGTVGSYSSLPDYKGFREVFREKRIKDELITYSLSEDFLQSRGKAGDEQDCRFGGRA